MKATIQGVTITGDTEEIAELIHTLHNLKVINLMQKTESDHKKTTEQKNKTKKRQPKKNKNKTNKTQQQAQQAIEEYTKGKKTLSKIIIKICGGYHGAIAAKAKKLMKEKGIEYTPYYPYGKKQTPTQNGKPKQPQTRERKIHEQKRKRMSFMASRAHNLMRQYNYSREKAWAIAGEEWKRKGKKQKVRVDEPYGSDKPMIVADPGTNQLLLDMAQHIIANKGKMTYVIEGKALGCHTVSEWQNILFAFNKSKSKVAEYFGVKDRFKVFHNPKGRDSTIEYR